MSRLASVRIKLTTVIALFVAALLGAATTAVALASIPDTSGTIHSCYRSGVLGSGSLRVIDNSNSSCNANETSLSWSQNGTTKIAHFATNSDGTLNASYSDNVVGFKFIPDPNNLAVNQFLCIDFTFNPKFGFSDSQGGGGDFAAPVPGGSPGGQDEINGICGSGYNALSQSTSFQEYYEFTN